MPVLVQCAFLRFPFFSHYSVLYQYRVNQEIMKLRAFVFRQSAFRAPQSFIQHSEQIKSKIVKLLPY